MLVLSRRLCPPPTRFARRFHLVNEPITDARWPGWHVVVGVEVHAQIKSHEKLFSSARVDDAHAESNTNVTPFDAAFPGTLPSLNPKCVELAVRTGVALESSIQRRSAFDRKHYFYSDLPAGYQITQNYAPLAKGGRLHLDKHGIAVRIKQIQLEQDTGKTLFDARRRQSGIDLNRAGTALMEIVSEPDMRSPEEAGAYIRALQQVLRAVGASDGNMENGSLRCDVNVSVHRTGAPLGGRCEIKNLNSVKFAQVAIVSEARRQIALLEAGGAVAQETRGFDEDSAQTVRLRAKEDAPDYRYMPDPNLPPLVLPDALVERIRTTMPELPAATRARLAALGLAERDVGVLMSVDAGRDVSVDGVLGAGAVAYFDAVAAGRDAKLTANWITNELLGQLALRDLSFNENPVSALQIGELVDLVSTKQLTGTAGKTLLRHMLDHSSEKSPTAVARELDLLSTPSAGGQQDDLTRWCSEAIAALPTEAQAVRDGNPKVLNKILGRVMKASGGRADAQAARTVLHDLLSTRT